MARIERASNQKALDVRGVTTKQGKGWMGALGGGLLGGFAGGIPGAFAGAMAGDALEELARNKTLPNYKNIYEFAKQAQGDIDTKKKYMSGYFMK